MDFFFFFYNNDIQIHKSYISQPSNAVMEIVHMTRAQYFLYCFFIPYLKENCTNILLSFIYYIYYLQALSILKKENKQVRFICWHCGVLKMFFSKWWEQALNQCSLKDLGVCEGAGPIVVGPSASPFMDWPFSYYRLRRSNNIQSITL